MTNTNTAFNHETANLVLVSYDEATGISEYDYEK